MRRHLPHLIMALAGWGLKKTLAFLFTNPALRADSPCLLPVCFACAPMPWVGGALHPLYWRLTCRRREDRRSKKEDLDPSHFGRDE
jgi:hypothetical protein